MCECIYESFIESVTYNKKQCFKVKTVNLRGFTLRCDHPNNVVQLHNNKIFVIDSLLNVQSNPATEVNIDCLYIYGTVENSKKEVFDFPTSSIDVGMMEIVSWKKQKVVVKLAHVKCKCVLFNVNQSKIAVSLLHI